MKYERMKFKTMSEVQDASERLAELLSRLLTFDDLRDLAEIVDANSVNQDFYCSLCDRIDQKAATSPTSSTQAIELKDS